MEKKFGVTVVFNGGSETRFTFETEAEAVECAEVEFSKDPDNREWLVEELLFDDGEVVQGNVLKSFKI